MFFPKKNASLEIARQLVKNIGIEETLAILKEKKSSHTADPAEMLKLILALSACNLAQTLKAEFIVEKIDQDAQNEITLNYVMESLRKQDLVKLKDKTETENFRFKILEITGELMRFWREGENPAEAGPGPRYYCVKEILRRLGGETNYDLHDALFEMMYLQHKGFIDFFKEHLEKPA